MRPCAALSMIFRETTYSVLLASADEKLNSAVLPVLAPGEYWPVCLAKNGAEARRLAAERSFDLILVNDPLPGCSALQLAEELSAGSPAVAALLVRSEEADDVYFRCVEQGVSVIPKPLAKAAFLQMLHLLCASREKLRQSEAKQQTVEDRMAQIRLVNRAKWALIEQEGLTEPQAHRKIEKLAMDRRVSKEQIAEEILEKYMP